MFQLFIFFFFLETLMTNFKLGRQYENESRLSDSDFPSLPLIHHPNVIGSRSPLSAIGTKHQTFKSSSDSGFNSLDGMPLLDKALNEKMSDEDSEKSMEGLLFSVLNTFLFY